MRAPSVLLAALLTGGCYPQTVAVDAGASPQTGETSGTGSSGGHAAAAIDVLDYRDNLAAHPGCSTQGLSYEPASISGYPCALKGYAFPGGTLENTALPIVLLIHGNSDAPDSWEKWPKDSGQPMLAEKLAAAGFRTYAVDFRIDRVDDPQSNNDTENAARNIDHAWAVPIAERLVEATIEAFPDRPIAMVGFSLGGTIIRDALRRIYFRGEVNPWAHVTDLVLLAGANHGVSTYAKLCGKNPTMRTTRWRIMRRNMLVFARGRVRHSDHATIKLDGWHQVFMNTENEAASSEFVAFLD